MIQSNRHETQSTRRRLRAYSRQINWELEDATQLILEQRNTTESPHPVRRLPLQDMTRRLVRDLPCHWSPCQEYLRRCHANGHAIVSPFSKPCWRLSTVTVYHFWRQKAKSGKTQLSLEGCSREVMGVGAGTRGFQVATCGLCRPPPPLCG